MSSKNENLGGVRIVLLGCLLLSVFLPADSEAQPPAATMPRIRRLSPSTALADQVVLSAFRQGLKDHGSIERKNLLLNTGLPTGTWIGLRIWRLTLYGAGST